MAGHGTNPATKFEDPTTTAKFVSCLDDKAGLLLAAHRRVVNVLTSNSAFLIFAVLLCDSATVVITRCFKLLSFLQ